MINSPAAAAFFAEADRAFWRKKADIAPGASQQKMTGKSLMRNTFMAHICRQKTVIPVYSSPPDKKGASRMTICHLRAASLLSEIGKMDNVSGFIPV